MEAHSAVQIERRLRLVPAATTLLPPAVRTTSQGIQAAGANHVTTHTYGGLRTAAGRNRPGGY